LWSPKTNSDFINSVDTVYIFYRLWNFHTDSFSATRCSITARFFKTHAPYHVLLMTTCSCATKQYFAALQQQAGHSKLNKKRNADISCRFWMKYRDCCTPLGSLHEKSAEAVIILSNYWNCKTLRHG
jgi:hypothetical protein